MKQNQKIPMPYRESNQYVEFLTERSTEYAIRHAATHTVCKTAIALTAAASLLFIAGIAILRYDPTPQPLVSHVDVISPIEEFINTLTDEEARQIICHDIDEIPEY